MGLIGRSSQKCQSAAACERRGRAAEGGGRGEGGRFRENISSAVHSASSPQNQFFERKREAQSVGEERSTIGMEYVMRLSVLALPKCGIRLQAVIHPTGNRSAPTLLVDWPRSTRDARRFGIGSERVAGNRSLPFNSEDDLIVRLDALQQSNFSVAHP